jgi:PAS domain S-box-containing protein
MLNFLLLMADLWALGGLLIFLHYRSQSFGFAPLLFVLGGLSILLGFQFGIYIQPSPGFFMFLGSNVIVPAMLAAILILYVVNGATYARMTIAGLVGLNLLIVSIFFIYKLHLTLPGGGSFSRLPVGDLINATFARNNFASLIAFAADMVAIAVVYQGLKNRIQYIPEWIAAGLALLGSLWVDAVIYNIIGGLGTADFITFLPGDLIGKTVSALILWPLVGFYLERYAPRLAAYQGSTNRSTFDLLFGRYDAVKIALVNTEAALATIQQEKRRETAYYQEIIQHINEALWLAKPDRAFALYVNPAYERIWGRSAESLYKEPMAFMDAIHADDQERVRVAIANRLAKGHHAYDIEYRVVRPDATIRWVRDRAFPITDDRGEVYRIVGIVEDITERRLLEQQRMELTLEREKVKFLREFIGEVTHDLKSPLTTINLKIYALARTDDPVKRSVHLDELGQVSASMGKLIDNLMTLARLDSTREMELARVNVGEVIGNLCTTLRPQMEEKKLRLLLQFAEDTPLVQVDEDDLSRALGNLIENAVRYTPDGEQISIQTETQGGEILIRVSDTGVGIAPDELPHIFDRFYRAGNAHITNPGGSGLGLAIVKKIMEKHMGRIEISSEVGKGTTFTLYLPITVQAQSTSSFTYSNRPSVN